MTDYNDYFTGGSYFEGVTKPCKVCKCSVVISPNNSTWGGLRAPRGKIGFSIIAPCKFCGHVNSYVKYIKKTDLRMTDGLQEEV